MNITYSHDPLEPNQKHLQVSFKNELGLEFLKTINVPYNPDGTLNKEYFDQILEDQLRGVQHKVSLGAIDFVEPQEKVSYEAPK